MSLKDQQGNTISKEEDNLRCWKEHIKKVLNGDDPETETEVRRAIKSLKKYQPVSLPLSVIRCPS